MNVIIVSGVAIGIFLLSLLLTKKRKINADKFLIAYFVFFVLSQSYFYFETFDFLQHSPWMLLGRGLYLLGGPLFFYYVYSLTTSKSVSWKLYLVTLLTVLLYVFHFAYNYAIGFDETHIEIRNGILYRDGEPSLIWAVFTILFLLSDPFYLIWFYVLLKRYKQKTLTSLSNTEYVNLNWLNSLFYLWAILAIILFPITVLSLTGNWISFSFASILLQIGYVVFVFLVGYHGFRQTKVFSNDENQISRAVDEKLISYERSGLSSEQAEIFHQKLLALMTLKKPYLNGELTAKELAMELGVSTNYLSQVLSQNQGQNFFDFVNGYRVNEVKSRMQESAFKDYTLLAIALDSGFNSKTSFNTVFKKVTGQTPSQYHRTLKN